MLLHLSKPEGGTSAAAAPPPGRGGLVTPLVIAAATLLAYSNTFGASFHLDDWGIVVRNDRLLDLGAFWPPSGSRWLGELTFALNLRLLGPGVEGFHVVNLAIHVGAALLVAALAEATLRTPGALAGRTSALVRRQLPLAAALLFALHPLATQAVTYLVQRFTSLATMLYLLALVLFVRARLATVRDGRVTWRTAVAALGAVLAAAAAMKTKEISVTLPVVVVGYELLFFPAGSRRRLLLLLVPLAATAAIPLLDPTLGQRLASEAYLPRLSYALTQARVVVTYLRLLVWPADQNLDYDFPMSHAVSEPAVLASLGLLLGLAALGAGLVAAGRKTGRVEGLLAGGGIAWFFVTLSVESSVIPIRDVIFEHRVYLPGVGAALAFATAGLLGVERLRLPGDPARRGAVALALVAALLGGATWRRNLVWQDDLTLWSDVVAKSPGKARPHQFLGEAYAQRGELDAAVREYLLALRLEPRYLEAAYNLGNAYYAQRRLPQALAAFTLAVQVAPGHAMAHNNRGAVLQVLGDLAGAAAAYQEALRLDPDLALARGNVDRLRAADAGPGP